MKKLKTLEEYSDTNLTAYWWHRLLKVVYILSFFIAVGISIFQITDSGFDRFAKVGMLSDRMDSNIRIVGDLIKPGEKISINEYNDDSNYEKNGGWLLKQEYYCSTNIAEHVEEISAKTGVNFYKGNLDLVSLTDFKNYLIQNDAKCVQVLGLNSASRYGEVKKALAWGLETDNMAIWKVSMSKSLFSIFQTLFIIVATFFTVKILYYKVFLYVVFGPKK